jgi:hypothetical protein
VKALAFVSLIALALTALACRREPSPASEAPRGGGLVTRLANESGEDSGERGAAPAPSAARDASADAP